MLCWLIPLRLRNQPCQGSIGALAFLIKKKRFLYQNIFFNVVNFLVGFIISIKRESSSIVEIKCLELLVLRKIKLSNVYM